MAMRVSAEKRDKLKAHYLAGSTQRHTAHSVGVHENTVSAKFLEFRAEGLHRGPSRRKWHVSRKRTEPLRSVYTGPDMLGKAITKPPAPIGPDWIGKAIP